MSTLIERTFMEISEEPRHGTVSGDSKPLSGFRHLLAVVLLGYPGSGKTTPVVERTRGRSCPNE